MESERGFTAAHDDPRKGARVDGQARGWSRLCGLVLVVSLVVGLSAPIGAQAADGLFAGALAMLEAQRGSAPSMSINDAASRAQDRFGGRVISVTRAEQDGRRGFRVKVLLENGRVKTLFVDDRTGNVIDRRNHDR